MVDILTKKQRSYCMSKIRGSKTKPELILKDLFTKKGFDYQPKVYGKPDFIDYKKKIVVFIDGCFWHKCPLHFDFPETNKLFWKNKINKNALRDREVSLNYKKSRWRIIRIWEHKVKSFSPAELKRIVTM